MGERPLRIAAKLSCELVHPREASYDVKLIVVFFFFNQYGEPYMASKRKRQTIAANRNYVEQDRIDRFVYKLLRESSDEEVTPIKPHYKGKGKDHRRLRRDTSRSGQLTPAQQLACRLKYGKPQKPPKPVRRPAIEVRKLYYPSYGIVCVSEKPSEPNGWIYSKSLRGWVRSTFNEGHNHDNDE